MSSYLILLFLLVEEKTIAHRLRSWAWAPVFLIHFSSHLLCRDIIDQLLVNHNAFGLGRLLVHPLTRGSMLISELLHQKQHLLLLLSWVTCLRLVVCWLLFLMSLIFSWLRNPLFRASSEWRVWDDPLFWLGIGGWLLNSELEICNNWFVYLVVIERVSLLMRD